MISKISKSISLQPHRTDTKVNRRSSSPPPHQAFSEPIMDETVESAEEIINRWSYHHSDHHNSCPITPSLFSNPKETQDFMSAIKDLQVVMKFIISVKPNSNLLVRGQKLVETAMKRLEREFHLMLKSNKQYLDHESVSSQSSSSSSSYDSSRTSSVTDCEEDDNGSIIHHSEGELKNSKIVMDDLKLIADGMINAGYTKECMTIYKAVRKSTVHGALNRLGINVHSESSSLTSFHKMEWKSLDMRMKKWKSAAKVAVKMIFKGEKIMVDHVFSSASNTTREICFSEIATDSALALFSEPEHMAKSTKKSPEKIFRFLDTYDVIKDLGPEIQSIFKSKSTSLVTSQAETTLNKIADSIRSMLTEFESAIQKDSSKTLIPGGGIHPLTRYVMNYLCFLSQYLDSLTDIIASDSSTSPSSPTLPDKYFDSPTTDGPKSKLSEKFAWLILILLCKLDKKAELYGDVSLCYLFLSNNLKYVVSKVQSSSIQFIVGGNWVRKHEDVVRIYAANYEKMGWGKVIGILQNDKEITEVDQVKEVVKRFNVEFEEVYRKQLEWVGVDTGFREEVKGSLREKMVDKYREFYRRMVEEEEEGAGCDVKLFTPEELENYLDSMFSGLQQGCSSSSSGSGSSHGSGRNKTALSSPISKAGRGLRTILSLAVWSSSTSSTPKRRAL